MIITPKLFIELVKKIDIEKFWKVNSSVRVSHIVIGEKKYININNFILQ